MDGEPDLPEEELKDQLDVALAIARKVRCAMPMSGNHADRSQKGAGRDSYHD